ncbi:MAG: ABC transporter substrate-binding protein [Butyricicoccus sp.]|nr:ABC transporter substrate-binding protein [Butyricicoccus sp.]
MKKYTKIISILLMLCLALGLTACGGGREEEPPASGSDIVYSDLPSTSTDIYIPIPASGTDIQSASPGLPPVPDSELPMNVMVLNGATGFGMAKLMSEAENGAAALNYSFQVESDASNVTAALISGSADIAALPTNAAAALYNKTGGKVQLLALNTLGVLYVVVNGEAESISSMADLSGKTVYAPAQNPSFIFKYICQANGLGDVTIDNSYAQPADLRTALAAGEVDIAVLPEPMVTIAESANGKLVTALDLTAEWNAVAPVADSLVQGCVAVRADFAAEHPAEVAAFLDEYAQSIAYLSSGADDIGDIIESTGVFTNGAVAKKAVPNCNVCFVSGADMAAQMGTFLDIMLETAPESIGGAVPGEDFYYTKP